MRVDKSRLRRAIREAAVIDGFERRDPPILGEIVEIEPQARADHGSLRAAKTLRNTQPRSEGLPVVVWNPIDETRAERRIEALIAPGGNE
jgi:hypothetical protein